MSSRLLVATYRNRFGAGETSPYQAVRWAFFRSPREFAVTLRPLDNGPPLSFVLRLEGLAWRVNRVLLQLLSRSHSRARPRRATPSSRRAIAGDRPASLARDRR